MRPFAEWLAGKMSERRLTVRQVEIGMAAKGFKIGRSSVNTYMRDEVVPPMEKAEAFAAYFDDDEEAVRELIKHSRQRPDPRGVNVLREAGVGVPYAAQRLPQDILRELEAVTPILLPSREQTASAGNGNTVETEYVSFWPTPEQRHHRIEPITVSGDCLEPRLLAGHTAIVDYEAAYEVAPGRDADTAPIVLARHQGEEIFKAYVERDGDRFLEALDGRPPIPVGPDTELLGVVVEARYKLDRRRRR